MGEEEDADGNALGDEKEEKEEEKEGESDYGGGSESSIATARARTLHDFVEDGGIENLKTRLRHSIDYVQVGLSVPPAAEVLSSGQADTMRPGIP